MAVPHTALLVSVDLRWALKLASAWVATGDSVTVVLLDTAVSAARAGHVASGAVTDALAAGVVVTVEEGALQRRALPVDRLLEGIKPVDLDEVADLVVEGADRVVWL